MLLGPPQHGPRGGPILSRRVKTSPLSWSPLPSGGVDYGAVCATYSSSSAEKQGPTSLVAFLAFKMLDAMLLQWEQLLELQFCHL